MTSRVLQALIDAGFPVRTPGSGIILVRLPDDRAFMIPQIDDFIKELGKDFWDLKAGMWMGEAGYVAMGNARGNVLGNGFFDKDPLIAMAELYLAVMRKREASIHG